VAPGLALPGLLVLGLLLRGLVVLPPEIDGDEAWVGIGALGVLRGVFPPFLYGQPYMGGLEAFLDAPLVLAVGAARWTLKIVPVAAGVLFVWLTYRLARRLFDGPTAVLAALWAASPSWALLRWAVSGRLHYSLTPVLGVLAFLVAVRLLDGRPERAPARWLVLGILGGLIFWHNYLGIVYLGGIAGLLLLVRFRRTLADGLRLALPGFVLGSLPMWIYNAQTGRPFVTPRGTWAPAEAIGPNLERLVTAMLPDLLGAPPSPRGPAALAVAALAGAAFLAGLAAIVARALRGDPRAGFVPLVLLALAGLVTTSVYGVRVPSRYLFPIYAVAPLVFGAGLGLLARQGAWARGLAYAVAVVLAGTNAWASLDAQSAVLHPERLERFRAAEADERRMLATLSALGLDRAYSEDYGVLNYTSGGSLVFSRTERDDPAPAFATAVDGAARVAYVSGGRSRRLEAGLAALDARFELEQTEKWWIYHGFALPRLRYRELPPDGWSASASERAQHAPDVLDRVYDTVWTGDGGQRPGTTLTVDLGRLARVGMVAWLPTSHRTTPRGLEVSTSEDGRAWQPAARVRVYETPVYWSGPHPFFRLRRPRVEVRFAPRPARHVRIVQLGTDEADAWAIRELFVYEPVDDPRPPDVLGVDPIADRLLDRGVARVYGDHWTLSRLRVVSGGRLRVLPVHVYIDNHGRSDLYRDWRHPPDHGHPDRMRWSRTAVVLETWTGTAPAFEALLRESGLRFRREAIGDYLVYSGFVIAPRPTRALASSAWNVSAGSATGRARRALDGDRGTAWAADPAAAPARRWLGLDLGAPTEVAALQVDLGGPRPVPPSRLALAASLDGRTWQPVPATVVVDGPLYWTGTHALRGGVERVWLRFPPMPVRALRLAEAGAGAGDPWPVHELRVFGPDGDAPAP
jgi:hypothetical protein